MSETFHTYQPPADLLTGRNILITGASDGIGKACAKAFAAHGAQVILLGRSSRKLEKVYDEICNNGWVQPAIYPLNLATADLDAYLELAEILSKEFGQLHGLLHNAAEIGTLTPVENYDLKQWFTVIQTNLNAAFVLTHVTLKLLKLAQNAAILFTGASQAQQGQAYWSAYSASKFAINGLMQSLAAELEDNTQITVNCIDPGQVRTKLRGNIFPAHDPTGLPQPDDIVNHYLYLMGSDSNHVTGQYFTI